jgi:hypothetical protein
MKANPLSYTTQREDHRTAVSTVRHICKHALICSDRISASFQNAQQFSFIFIFYYLTFFHSSIELWLLYKVVEVYDVY